MPLLSIITAAWAPSETHVEFIFEAYESLRGQESLGEWDWEWVVQEDGERPQLRERLPNDLRIRYAAIGMRLGTAACRTLALERARGEATRCLDQDDVLLNRGLAIPLELLANYPRAEWAAGERWELIMPERRVVREPLTTALADGLVEPGKLTELLREIDLFVIHCAGLTIRTDIFRAFGGWMAVPRSEDVITLAAINMYHAGAYSSQPTFLYRRWPDQITQQQWWHQLEPIARSILWQRVEAIGKIGQRNRGWR